MKTHLVNLTIATLILIAGGCATYDRTAGLPPLRVGTKTPEHITLRAVGSPGQKFTAVLNVDGTRRELSAVTPAEFELDCVVLVGEETKFDGDGSFNFMIERLDPKGLFYTPPVKDFRCFRYHSGTIGILAQK